MPGSTTTSANGRNGSCRVSVIPPSTLTALHPFPGSWTAAGSCREIFQRQVSARRGYSHDKCGQVDAGSPGYGRRVGPELDAAVIAWLDGGTEPDRRILGAAVRASL